MINKYVNKLSGIEIIAFYTSQFSCSYHAAWHAHEHTLNINHAACLRFYLSCNIKRWYLINFPINYENRIYFFLFLSFRFFTCYCSFFTIMQNLGSSCSSFCSNLHQHDTMVAVTKLWVRIDPLSKSKVSCQKSQLIWGLMRFHRTVKGIPHLEL